MEPVVSICCTTYNHEKYIADALDSFLMQKTSFPIEILIHDDASTDNTASIIEKYEKKYPKIIKPIYQVENQYSKGKKPLRDFIIPLVRGKFIATCEGYDFWIDNKKLQKQVEFLESNQDYIMCFHKVKVVDTNKNPLGRYIGLSNEGSKEISVKDAATGGVVHVSSRLIKSDFYKKPIPKWIDNAKHGDYAFALYITAEGKVFYIDEIMSAYRKGVENSMMTNFRENYSKENDIKYHLNRIETLNMADGYYNYKYHDDIKKVNLISEVIIAILEKDYSVSARNKYMNYIKQNGILSFIKIVLLKGNPLLSETLIKLKRKV